MSTTTQGDVEIQFDGGKAVLKCTLDASEKVCAFFGNFANANARVTTLEPEALVRAIAAGLGKSIDKPFETLVWQSGYISLSYPVRKWLDLLANGGREYVAPTETSDAPKNL